MYYFCTRYTFLCFFFFFQAEDGIRDLTVTGVQTCALPIYPTHHDRRLSLADRLHPGRGSLELAHAHRYHLSLDRSGLRLLQQPCDAEIQIGRASCRERV